MDLYTIPHGTMKDVKELYLHTDTGHHARIQETSHGFTIHVWQSKPSRRLAQKQRQQQLPQEKPKDAPHA